MQNTPLKIGLVQISHQIGRAFYLPYSVGLLQAYLQHYAPERFEFLPLLYRFDSLVEASAQLSSAQIIGLSLYVWNERRSLALAQRLKELVPDCLIVAGGPQVPDQAADYLKRHPYLDIVVHGPGEASFLALLEADGDWSQIPGVSYYREQQFFTRPLAPRVRDLSQFPSAYLSQVFEPLFLENSDWIATLETNRGCPFACTYCDWGSAIASKVYTFPLERIQAEIEWLGKNRIENVYLADANFGIFQRDLEIAQAVVQVKAKYGYPQIFQTQSAKNITQRMIAAQRILAEGGLQTSAAISLQSLHPATLQAIKRDNISLETYQQLQNYAIEVGLHAFTDLILGLPEETYASFTKGLETVMQMGQHSQVLFHNAALLPNAEMAQVDYRQRYGLQTTWVTLPGSLAGEIPELLEIVVATSALSREDWRRAHVFAWTTSFLYYNNKLLQGVFQVLYQQLGISFVALIEAFMQPGTAFPLLTQIQTQLAQAAWEYQQGYQPAAKRTGIWAMYSGWHVTPDTALQFQLCDMGRMAHFYTEAGLFIEAWLKTQNLVLPERLLEEALMFNYQLFLSLLQQQHFPIPVQLPPALPEPLDLTYNLAEFYRGYLSGQRVVLERGYVK